MVTMNLLQYTFYNSHLSYQLRNANITTPINQPSNKAHTETAQREVSSNDTVLTITSRR